jgi:hypothetical protein
MQLIPRGGANIKEESFLLGVCTLRAPGRPWHAMKQNGEQGAARVRRRYKRA